MRLILDAEIRPETVERLRALSPELEVVDVYDEAAFDARRLADPEVEVIVGSRPPADLARRAAAALAAGPLGRRRPPGGRSAVAQGRCSSRTPAASTPCRSASTSPGWSCGSTSRPRRWTADQAAHRWPRATPPTARRSSAARPRSIAGYGSIGREVARQLSALGMRIVAVKPRPEVRADDRLPRARDGRPGRLDPRADRRRRRRSPRSPREADVLILTMPLTDASRGIVERDGHRRAAAERPG